MKVKKEYNVGTFVKNIIIIPIIVLYLVLSLGNIGIELELPHIITRYIPAAITGFLVTLIVYKSGIKKLHKSDAGTVKKAGYLAPIGIAIILLLYGLYSLHSNIKAWESDMKSSVVSILYGDYGKELIEKQIAEAKKTVTIMWAVSAIVYVASAELSAFLTLRNLENKLLPDPESNDNNYATMNTGGDFSVNTSETTFNGEAPPENNENTINWNI